MPDVLKSLTDEFGSHVDDLKGKNTKDIIREFSKDLNLDREVIDHFSSIRKNGNIAIMVPYRNKKDQTRPYDMIRLRAKSLQMSECMEGAPFDLFATDVENFKDVNVKDIICRAEKLLPESDCTDTGRLADTFYSHSVFGYFSVLDVEGLTDEEVAAYALSLQLYIKEKFDLYTWILACDIKDKVMLSPYLLKLERVNA